MTTDETEKFKAIVIMANRVAREFNGALDTCVLTSYALAAALTDLGYADARPVRVEAGSFPDEHKLHGAILGGPPCGRTPKGYWCGHLAVCIGQSWLLDPTLDQSNDTNGWTDAGVGVEPVAASLTPEFWDLALPPHRRLVWVRSPTVETRYMLVPQKGFTRTPDARPSRWRPLAKEITEAIRAPQEATRRFDKIERFRREVMSMVGRSEREERRQVAEEKKRADDELRAQPLKVGDRVQNNMARQLRRLLPGEAGFMFAIGDRVAHGKFGPGTVESVDGITIMVMFDAVGRKQIVHSFLERAE
jgi:hypothetical protein